MPNETYFHEIWLSGNGFKEQIVSKENTEGKLILNISLSSMNGKALHSYATRKKHKKMFIRILRFDAVLIQDVWLYFLMYFCYNKSDDMVYFTFHSELG